MSLQENSAGRQVPTEINGREAIPYMGVGGRKMDGHKAAPLIRSAADYPDSGDKRVDNLKAALVNAGLRDGMVISTHHHFRNGDLIANQIFDIAKATVLLS